MLRRTTVAIAAAALAAAVLTPVSGAQAHTTQAPDTSTKALVAAERTTIRHQVPAAQTVAAGIYTVVTGDTLSGIAGRYSTTWPALLAANTFISNPNLIYPGQVLTLTAGSSRQAPAAASAPAPQQTASGWVNPVCATGIGDNIGAGRGHKGVDLVAPHGQPIRAAAAGTVTTGWQDGAGNYTVINHGGGVATAYLHQSSYAVRSGWVNAGQIIGYVGSTGDSSGPHLHFEVWTNGYWVGTFQNPISWLNSRGVRLGC